MPIPQFPDNDVLGRMQSALMAWRRISEAMRQIVRASEGQASRALFDDLEAVAHAFDSFPMLWALPLLHSSFGSSVLFRAHVSATLSAPW